jgi:hypothetical protein
VDLQQVCRINAVGYLCSPIDDYREHLCPSWYKIEIFSAEFLTKQKRR